MYLLAQLMQLNPAWIMFDNMFVTNSESSVLDFRISDYCMSSLRLSVASPVNKNVRCDFYAKPRIDYAKLIQILFFETWENVYVESFPSEAYDIFAIIVKNSIELCYI